MNIYETVDGDESSMFLSFGSLTQVNRRIFELEPRHPGFRAKRVPVFIDSLLWLEREFCTPLGAKCRF